MLLPYAESSSLRDRAASLLNNTPLNGVIRQRRDGFVYLSVASDFVEKLYPLVAKPGVIRPPYYGRNGVGAHVSVIKSDEADRFDVFDIKECGQRLSFSLGSIYSIRPLGWGQMQRVWFLSVESPSLERLRDRYGLEPKINGHDFHITFACRPR